MTGDDLITALAGAHDGATALAIAHAAPRAARLAAADLLYVEAEGHGMPWIERAIVAEARS